MQCRNEKERKNSGDIFMTATEKIYHIYAKEKCIYHSLKEEEFKNTWENLKGMVGIMKTDYEVNDLSYIELSTNIGGGNNLSAEPPGTPSY
jgi:hypothetical protein